MTGSSTISESFRFNAKFVDVISTLDSGVVSLDFTHFDHVKPLHIEDEEF